MYTGGAYRNQDHMGKEEEMNAAWADALDDVGDELARGMKKFPENKHSAHHAHSVIREEFEELWEHVRADTGASPEARKEAVQLAAMAVRYVVEVCDEPAC